MKNQNLKMYKEFINTIKDKKLPPKNIDWDEEHYSQFEENHSKNK